MEVEKTAKEIVITLNREETLDLQAGRSVQNKSGVISPDAKVEVSPLSAIDPSDVITTEERFADDRLEKAAKAPLKGHLFSNEDLQIFVPAIKLTDVRLGGARLPRESIETPTMEKGKEYIEHCIPQDGVKLVFGGSAKIIDIPTLYA